MRLLTWNSSDEIILTEPFDERNIPPYTILSHTWGADSDEVTFADLQQGRASGKPGYEKIRFCCRQARKDQIKHFWIDTCCIDKANYTELSEAINSMYRWYSHAEKCYVYLSDVQANHGSWESSLRTSRWFTRGWTLQELLAPKVVEFFSCDGVLLGTKETLSKQIHEVTGLPLAALSGATLAQFPTAERWQWARDRQTRKTEDGAYCMFGIFDVFMPLIYGEGRNAFRRLEEAVKQRSSNIRGSESDNHTVISFPPLQSPPPAHQRHTDDGHAGRALKRRRVDQSEPCCAQSHMKSTGEKPNYDEDKYDSLVKSLLFNRIDFRVNNVNKALLSTCEWLWDHPDFQSWYTDGIVTQHNGFLWIKGKPGCGKSTLMKAVLEWMKKRNVKFHMQQTIIPYFFHARASDSVEKSALGLYRTVVYHLLSTHEFLRPIFMEKFALKDPGPLGEGWTAAELQELLSDFVESKESLDLRLFIDALDEAEYESDARQMISFLVQLSERAAAAGGACCLRICLSSRHYPHISIGQGLDLVVEEQPGHGLDIETYIEKRLTCPSGPDRETLRASILRKSACIFLWVFLVVGILNKLYDGGAPLCNMQACLDKIPENLNELFRDILLKSNNDIAVTVLLFQWVIFSMRPLEPVELSTAIEYSQHINDPAWSQPSTTPPSYDRIVRYILNRSRGLVEVVEVALKQPPVIQFIHESVREFLISDSGLASIVPDLFMNLAGTSHEIMRIACLSCISANAIIPEEYRHYCEVSCQNDSYHKEIRSEIRLRLPFLDYAITFLLEHAEQAQRHDVPQQNFLQTHMDGDGVWLDTHRLWWNVLESFVYRKVESGATMLCFLLKQGYFNLVFTMPNLSDVVNNTHGNEAFALSLASAANHPRAVQLLLDAGADINAYGRNQETALRAASSRGHKKMVQILLDAGADVNVYIVNQNTALQAASAHGHQKIVQLLLDAGADINAHGQHQETALQAALNYGQKEIVKILLNAGVDVNVYGAHQETALRLASLHGYKEIVQALLEAGADVNTYGRNQNTALRTASVYGHREIVQILLEAGADVNAYTVNQNTALQAALAHDNQEIVQLLLDAGAVSPDGSALYAASVSRIKRREGKNMVQALLKAGADIDASGGPEGTALQGASACGDKEIVRILLAAGADVNAHKQDQGTALIKASSHGYKEIVQILLEAGADVNMYGQHQDTALRTASKYGYKEIVQILLEAGADVNMHGQYQDTVLRVASYRGYKEIVQMLLEAGADVNAQGQDQQTMHLIATARDR